MSSAEVLSLADFIARAVRELHPYFKGFVCAIFGVDDREIPYPVGSGVLLRVGPYFFLVTAAHVLDERERSTLYVWGETGLVALNGKYHSLIAPVGRNEDRLDFGFVLLAESVATELASHYAFLDPPDLNVNEIVENQAISEMARYVFVGYPGSRNKPRPTRTLKLAAILISLFPAPPEKYRKLGLRIPTHVVADFKRKLLANQNGTRTRGPKPDGMSGCGVWYVGGVEVLRGAVRPKLVAIMTEYRTSEQVFVAVRISLAVSAIQAAYPETLPLLPRPRLINPHVSIVRDRIF